MATNRFSFFEDLVSTLVERGSRVLPWTTSDWRNMSLSDLCHALLSRRGEASGVSMADHILERYAGLEAEEKRDFFLMLAGELNVDQDALRDAARAYADDPSQANLDQLQRLSEPSRQNLLRLLNTAPSGTLRLVRMREDLMPLARELPELSPVDQDFRHLFASWFNRGFLVMRHIDWQTPAHILEKIIAYEAVHEISDWDDLRRRLQPDDRRCFAFFHPAMPDEPLVFVEVALAGDVATSIQDVLSDARDIVTPQQANTAVFYSISNCQKGLQGVSFGHFLIKQVASDLKAEITGLKTFVTLSPVPNFMHWLRNAAEGDPDGAASRALVRSMEDWRSEAEIEKSAKPELMAQAADYFLNAKRGDGKPIDAVARFHLGNGALLRQINWRGDMSDKGLANSAGMMVNYEYDLGQVEANHEAYAETGAIKTTSKVRGLLPSRAAPRVPTPVDNAVATG